MGYAEDQNKFVGDFDSVNLDTTIIFQSLFAVQNGNQNYFVIGSNKQEVVRSSLFF